MVSKISKCYRLLVLSVLGISVSNMVFADGGSERFQLTPLFLWGANINGDVSTGFKDLPITIEYNDDILENLEAVFSLELRVRQGHWSFFGEYQNTSFSPGVATNDVLIAANSDFDNIMAELGVGYVFNEGHATTWEILGGLRYTDQEFKSENTVDFSELDFFPFDPVFTLTDEGGDDWFHPFVGVRLEQALLSKLKLTARFDVGYAGSDNSALNGFVLFDYRFLSWGSVFAGYRAIKYDYANDSQNNYYAFDATMQGPLLGLSFYW